jgi:hypothetical protein
VGLIKYAIQDDVLVEYAKGSVTLALLIKEYKKLTKNQQYEQCKICIFDLSNSTVSLHGLKHKKRYRRDEMETLYEGIETIIFVTDNNQTILDIMLLRKFNFLPNIHFYAVSTLNSAARIAKIEQGTIENLLANTKAF